MDPDADSSTMQKIYMIRILIANSFVLVVFLHSIQNQKNCLDFAQYQRACIVLDNIHNESCLFDMLLNIIPMVLSLVKELLYAVTHIYHIPKCVTAYLSYSKTFWREIYAGKNQAEPLLGINLQSESDSEFGSGNKPFIFIQYQLFALVDAKRIPSVNFGIPRLHNA